MSYLFNDPPRLLSEFPNLVTAFIVLPIIAAILLDVGRAATSPLRRVPGPFWARFTKFYYLYIVRRGNFQEDIINLHKKYGPVVRISPNHFSVSPVSCDDIGKIMGIKSHFPKADWYKTWMPPNMPASLFSDTDPKNHAAQRRKFQNAYSISSVLNYEPFVDECTKIIASHFDRLSCTTTTSTSENKGFSDVIDLGRWFQCFAMDVIGSITFGHRFGLLDTGEDPLNIFGEVEKRTQYSGLVGFIPWAHPFLFPIISRFGGHGYIATFARRLMAERESEVNEADENNVNLWEGGRPKDFVSRFLEIHQRDKGKMSEFDMFITCNTNIGAGSDTTSIALSAVFYYLLHPKDKGRTMLKLREEIDKATREGRLSDVVTFKEAQELPYLQLVIKESLRLHSVVGMAPPRVVSESSTIGGVDFLAGAVVSISPWVVHRSTEIFGEDADSWYPERWEKDEAKVREMEKWILAWGGGSRTCIGKGIAMMEMEKLVPQLVRGFEFELEEKLKEKLEGGGRWGIKTTVFSKMYGFSVKVRKRV